MNLREHFLRMFAYDGWANRECLAAICKSADSADALRRIAHILSAEKLWLERLQKVPQSLPVWPTASIEDCTALVEEMSTRWREYLKEIPSSAFDEQVRYRNSKGEEWSNSVEDIVTHVLMHSAYHRGQVALEMRISGNEPAYTDFIHGIRQGLVD